MVDENGGSSASAHEGQDLGDAMASAQSAVSGTIAKLGPAEKLVVLGAAALLIVWVLFDLLIDEYSTGSLPFALALVVVGAAYSKHNGGAGSGVRYTTILFVCGGLIGIFGVVDIIEEVRGGIFDADGATVIGALAYYAAAIVTGVGALQLRGR